MSIIRRLRRLYTEDRPLNQLQNNINEVLDGLRLSNIIDGNLVTATFKSGTATIPHNLERLPQGWMVVDKTETVDVWRDSWDKIFITLSSSVDTTVTLWIF